MCYDLWVSLLEGNRYIVYILYSSIIYYRRREDDDDNNKTIIFNNNNTWHTRLYIRKKEKIESFTTNYYIIITIHY